MKTSGQLAIIFILAGLGAQAGYPVFGWIHITIVIIVVLALSWVRHRMLRVTVAEISVIVCSGTASMLLNDSHLETEAAIFLRLLSLCSITTLAWIVFPGNIKEQWLLSK